MKVFRLVIDGDSQFIAANSLLLALFTYKDVTGTDLESYTENDFIEEVDPDDFEKIIITNAEYDEDDPDDKEEHTLKELMESVFEPILIATSAYGY